jgi:hypothetical protein
MVARGDTGTEKFRSLENFLPRYGNGSLFPCHPYFPTGVKKGDSRPVGHVNWIGGESFGEDIATMWADIVCDLLSKEDRDQDLVLQLIQEATKELVIGEFGFSRELATEYFERLRDGGTEREDWPAFWKEHGYEIKGVTDKTGENRPPLASGAGGSGEE